MRLMNGWGRTPFLIVILFGIYLGVVILAIALSKEPDNCHYEWQDALGNYGTAKSCYTEKDNLICETDDATRAVINYTRICKK